MHLKIRRNKNKAEKKLKKLSGTTITKVFNAFLFPIQVKKEKIQVKRKPKWLGNFSLHRVVRGERMFGVILLHIFLKTNINS